MDFKEIVSGLSEAIGAEIKEVTEVGGVTMPILVVPHNRTALDLTPYVKAWEAIQSAPLRRSGTFVAETLASLTDWAVSNIDGSIVELPFPPDMPTPADDAPPAQRPLGKSLTFFAQGLAALGVNWKAPTLSVSVIGNYSKMSSAAWHDFKGEFNYPVSLQWKDWAAHNGEAMTQADFAKFIENRVSDLGMRGTDEPLGDLAAGYLASFDNATDASPIEIIRLSRGLDMFANFQVSESRDYQTGQGGVTFKEEHQAGDGKKLVVPPLFWLRIPIFMDNTPALIPVRLRYRIVQGKGIVWFYEMLRPELHVHDMFLASLQALKQSGHVVLLGKPDMPTVAIPVRPMVVDGEGHARLS